MRAYRNVNLNLPGALISLPVSIAKAVVANGNDPRLEVVGPEGEDLRQVYVDAEGTEVDRKDTLRKAPTGTLISQDQLSEINEQTKLTDLTIQEVVPVSAIQQRRVLGSYYVYSNKKHGNEKAFATFCKALKKVKSAAVVKWTPSSRQQLLCLYPEGDALLAVAVAFAEDDKAPDEDVVGHAAITVNKAEVDLAAQLLERVKGDGSILDQEEDEALPLKAKLLEGGSVAPAKESVAKPAGPDFTAQLEAALAAVDEKVKA